MTKMKLFVLHCMVLCAFVVLTASIKLHKPHKLCPTPRKTSCSASLKLNCLYARGILVGVICARNEKPCDELWQSVCRPPLIPKCKSYRRECVCSCVETRPVKRPSINEERRAPQAGTFL
ncbi:uncharacterized protein LOC119167932 [Rhipicephalus microplus]|uniref:uncharacterized protein LOC119167932 n=1 Tax=Rhipicephalus microplus TaxID=6941 RepID=UPI003F6AE388